MGETNDDFTSTSEHWQHKINNINNIRSINIWSQRGSIRRDVFTANVRYVSVPAHVFDTWSSWWLFCCSLQSLFSSFYSKPEAEFISVRKPEAARKKKKNSKCLKWNKKTKLSDNLDFRESELWLILMTLYLIFSL